MRIPAMILGAMALTGISANAGAQIIKDPPWNPDHINHLPPEVRSAVLAMCSQAPSAGHYFATYFHGQINLHFEHFHCEQARTGFCNGSECLHQVYRLSTGHYHLAQSFYGSRND
jgi:hypothetical protein